LVVNVCWFAPGQDNEPVAAGYVVVDDAVEVVVDDTVTAVVVDVGATVLLLLLEGRTKVELTA